MKLKSALILLLLFSVSFAQAQTSAPAADTDERADMIAPGRVKPVLNLPVPKPTSKTSELNQKLDQVRSQKLEIEKALIDAEKTKKSTEAQLKRLKSLQSLQHQEKALTEKRLQDLEKYLTELQSRREDVQKRIDETQVSLKQKIAKLIHPILYQHDQLIRGDEGDGEKFMKEQILSSLTLSELKELEGLNADLLDADDIEGRIEQEKQQIASLMQDISEQESLIQFHQKLRLDSSHEKKEEHLKQLEEYRQLKVSEVEIEKMISQFSDRQKLEQDQDQKKKLVPLTLHSRSLPWPMKGKLVGTYGQHRDEKTGLNIFKKGIDILTMNDNAEVTSVMNGRVQFAGDIPGKGKVMIVEHEHMLYTIYGGLKEMVRTTGDDVKASEKLGSMESESPLYFEIRSRNVAIDPLKWLQ